MNASVTNDAGEFWNATGRFLRRGASAILAGAFLVLVVAAAGVVAIAALAVAAILALGVALFWLVVRLRHPRQETGDPRTLVARRGPHGWSVDAAGRNGV